MCVYMFANTHMCMCVCVCGVGGSVCVCICVCVCVCERERERGGGRERERERECVCVCIIIVLSFSQKQQKPQGIYEKQSLREQNQSNPSNTVYTMVHSVQTQSHCSGQAPYMIQINTRKRVKYRCTCPVLSHIAYHNNGQASSSSSFPS